MLVLAGCRTGSGEGWVSGELRIDDCGSQKAYSSDPGRTFALPVDFYAGDPLISRIETAATRRSSLTLRLQGSSNSFEQTDGLMLQLRDLEDAARAIAAGMPLSLTDSSNKLVRAQIYLYNSCPANRSPIVASNRTMTLNTGAAGEKCLEVDAAIPPSCPTLTAAQRTELLGLCQEDFNLRTPERDKQITRLLGGGACLFLCQMGIAHYGVNTDNFQFFEIDYGDVISGIFSFGMVDQRAVELNECAHASGQVNGMFRFDLLRTRVSQSFP